MAVTVTISGIPVSIQGNISIQDALNERSTASFVIIDATGTTHYTRSQSVTITDSVTGVLFTGFIAQVDEDRLMPTTTLLSTCQCIDNTYLADKRLMTTEDYTSRYAGDIVADLTATTLSAEGITAAVAVRHDNTSTLFGQGTLSNTVATNNVSGGDLELASAGTVFSKTETTTSDFSTGTLTNVSASNNALILASTQAMKYVGTATSNLGSNLYCYYVIWRGSITINSNDQFIYDVFINSNSPQICCGLDLVCSDGTTMRDAVYADQLGNNVHPATDLTGYADDQWYHRVIQLTTSNVDFAGKTIVEVLIGFEGDKSGTYIAYARNATLQSSGFSVRQTFFGSTLNAAQQQGNIGYYNTALTKVTAYNHTGSRLSPAYSMSAPGIVQKSLISWDAAAYTQATGSSTKTYPNPVVIQTSFDGGATWQTCTSQTAIPNLLAGMNTSGLSLLILETLNLSGPDPTITPMLSDLTATVRPSFSATKTDVSHVDLNSTNFGTGTLSNTIYNSGLEINGKYRTWDTGDLTNMTVFGTAGSNPVLSISGGQVELRCGLNPNPSQMAVRLDFAGTWADFVCEFDFLHPDTTLGVDGAFLYRTTGWQNNNDTYAYSAEFQPSGIALYKGSNSSSGTNTATSLGSASVPWLTNTMYHIKVVISGSSHKFYINDILYLSVTDSTYTSAGNVGFRLYNNTIPRNSVYFDNFGIMNSSFTASRTHSSVSINSVGTVFTSLIQWQAVVPSTTTLLIEASIDGGSTWQTCTSGSPIPQLTVGVSASGKSLLIRETLTTQQANATPLLTGIAWYVLGNYSASGTRISPVLNLTAVTPRCGSTSVSWNAVIPTNTTLTVDSSLNGSSWTNVSASGNPVNGLTAQPAPTIDGFTANTSGNYTSSFGTGGSSATWTYDTPNSRITASGGSKAVYLANALTGIADVDMQLDCDETDAGGCVWRWTNASNFYQCMVQDASSSGTHNDFGLYKMASGTRTRLTGATIAFVRGTYHRIRITMLGSVITGYFDGVQMFTYTDGSPLGSGQIGLAQETGTVRFYQFYVQPQGAVVSSNTVYTRITLTSTDPTVTPQLTDLTTAVYSPDLGAGALIAQTQYQYQRTLSASIDDLSKQSNFWWTIDKTKRVKFQQRPGTPAPFIIASANQNLTVVSRPKLSNMSTAYRNRQWIIGGTGTTTPPPDTRIGDGFTQTWTLAYPVASAPTITRNGIAATVGVSGVDTGKDFYYQLGSAVISQDPSEIPLNDAESLVFTYVGQIAITIFQDNTAQQTLLASIDGSTGIVEAVETAAVTTTAAANSLAQARLTEYGILGRTFTFETLQYGLDSGQYLTIFVPEFGINDGQFLITQCTQDIETKNDGSPFYRYQITCTDGPNLGSWTNLFIQP